MNNGTRHERLLIVTLCLAAVVPLVGACGGGSGLAGQMDGGSASGGDTKTSGSGCEGGDLLFPLRQYGEQAGVIYMMRADETNVYFAAQNEEGIFRAPAVGGEPVNLPIEGEEKMVNGFWLHQGGLLLYFGARSGKPPRLATMPLTGGAVTPFMDLTDFVGAKIRNHEFGADGTTFYRDGDLLLGKGTHQGMVGIFTVDLIAKTHTFIPLPGSPALEVLSRAGNTFYFSTSPPSFLSAGELSSVGLDGGTVTPLFPEMYLDPILGDESFVYLLGLRRDETNYKKRLYRMPAGGGELTLLEDDYLDYYYATSTPEGHLMDLGSDNNLYLPRGGGAPVKVGSCPEGQHAIAASGKSAYISFVVEEDPNRVTSISKASIARFSIP